MCTVTASIEGSSLVVTMNRDERRSRIEGMMHEAADCCYPTDQESGGTWCGISAHGFIVCLLNRYDAPPQTHAQLISRGTIIPQALTFSDIEAVSDYIGGLKLARFNGFQLLILSRERGVCHNWDTQNHSVEEVSEVDGLFRSSSSVQSVSVPKRRELRFKQWRQAQRAHVANTTNEPVIPQPHLREPGVAPNESIFMVRENTHTKSITQMSVGANFTALHYWPAQRGWSSSCRESWRSTLKVVDGPGVIAAKAG